MTYAAYDLDNLTESEARIRCASDPGILLLRVRQEEKIVKGYLIYRGGSTFSDEARAGTAARMET